MSGSARAVVGDGANEVHIATLGPGDVAGVPDSGDAPFALTVRASEPVRAVLLDAALAARHRGQLPRDRRRPRGDAPELMHRRGLCYHLVSTQLEE